MSLQSESDLSSSDESLNCSIEEESLDAKIPLSTSVFLERLPHDKQRMLTETILDKEGQLPLRLAQSMFLSERVKEPSRIPLLNELEEAVGGLAENANTVDDEDAKTEVSNDRIDNENNTATASSGAVHNEYTSIDAEGPEKEPLATHGLSMELISDISTSKEVQKHLEKTEPETTSTSKYSIQSDTSLKSDSSPNSGTAPKRASSLKPGLDSDSTLKADSSPKLALEAKTTIRFVPIGSTPRINPLVFTISSNQTVSILIKFLAKKLKTKDHVYLYIQNSFQPTPDEKLSDLYNLFRTNNELIVSYCESVAFG